METKSHLLQMRGLKRETENDNCHVRRSHLLQMRGLKQFQPERLAQKTVASFTDAWIETTNNRLKPHLRAKVASFTDAWIETYQSAGVFSQCQSHLLQMRGLKRPF